MRDASPPVCFEVVFVRDLWCRRQQCSMAGWSAIDLSMTRTSRSSCSKAKTLRNHCDCLCEYFLWRTTEDAHRQCRLPSTTLASIQDKSGHASLLSTLCHLSPMRGDFIWPRSCSLVSNVLKTQRAVEHETLKCLASSSTSQFSVHQKLDVVCCSTEEYLTQN